MTLTPAQSRAARGWLDWTQAELAKRAVVGISTVRSFEDGTRTPIANNLTALRRALEEAGAGVVLSATEGTAAPAQEGKRGDPPRVSRSRAAATPSRKDAGARGRRG
jgi:transcriptional regulator with XRE-family HTH domain